MLLHYYMYIPMQLHKRLYVGRWACSTEKVSLTYPPGMSLHSAAPWEHPGSGSAPRAAVGSPGRSPAPRAAWGGARASLLSYHTGNTMYVHIEQMSYTCRRGVCMCVCMRACVRACVCACVHAIVSEAYVCMWKICVCVCARVHVHV